MTRVSPRTNFHSSQLIRSLAELALVDTADTGNAFAEKLGQWIHFADAITLSAVHSGGVPSAPPARHNAQPDMQIGARLTGEFERIRTFLVNSITRSCAPNADKAGHRVNTHIKLPAPPVALPLDLATAYLPYRRFHEAHQRDMEASIQPLRFNIRDTLAKTSPRLRKLADLDATLEKIMRDRERQLLAKLPVLLKKRFEQLFKEHQQKLADSGQPDNPAGCPQADSWLARFCNDLQMLLLAEAELRLQPAMGLIEAFKQDTQ